MNQVVSRITDVPFHGADMEKKFEIVKYIDPRFDCSNPAYIDTRYVVVSGGPQISRYQTKCDEFSNDMYRWGNRRTLGSKFLYDSHWYIKYTVIVKINMCAPDFLQAGSPAAIKMQELLKDSIAFRPFPLTQCTRSIQLKLNDKEISVLPRETLAARMEYWDPATLHKGCTTCPCERLNVQTVMQHDKIILSDPFRASTGCMRGEKSNAMIAESQVDFHIGANNQVLLLETITSKLFTVFYAEEPMLIITLLKTVLVVTIICMVMRYSTEQSVSSMSLSSLSLSPSQTVQSSIPPCTT